MDIVLPRRNLPSVCLSVCLSACLSVCLSFTCTTEGGMLWHSTQAPPLPLKALLAFGTVLLQQRPHAGIVVFLRIVQGRIARLQDSMHCIISVSA